SVVAAEASEASIVNLLLQFGVYSVFGGKRWLSWSCRGSGCQNWLTEVCSENEQKEQNGAFSAF
ncbi:hypothetical protein, partial [Actinobacillus pleuropneumoniae]